MSNSHRSTMGSFTGTNSYFLLQVSAWKSGTQSVSAR